MPAVNFNLPMLSIGTQRSCTHSSVFSVEISDRSSRSILSWWKKTEKHTRVHMELCKGI